MRTKAVWMCAGKVSTDAAGKVFQARFASARVQPNLAGSGACRLVEVIQIKLQPPATQSIQEKADNL